MQHELLTQNLDAHTGEEISRQPQLWLSVFDLLQEKEQEINNFIAPLLAKKDLQLVLTGAGSSAFVGEAAQALVQKYTGRTTRAIATTDLVTHFDTLLEKERPTLLVSFARSGNSPESVETVNLADRFCSEVHHLMITCNKDGKLMQYAQDHPEKSHAILLPEEANDQSLAMTGSFTSMLLTILVVGYGQTSNLKPHIQRIVDQGNTILYQAEVFKKVAEGSFERVVFLGSGAMLGIARECHLKLQELTDGQVICKYDSFLGFRHGPRAVLNEKTLLVYLFSPDELIYRYELDLAESIAKDPRNLDSVSIGRPSEKTLDPIANLDLEMPQDQEWQIIPATLAGQLLGYFKSLQLGLNPDNPSVSGSISRVVQGVTIYDNPKI